jgi:hypothetical protein
VEDNHSGQLGRKSVWVGYCCGDQIGCQNEMGWEKVIFLAERKLWRRIWAAAVWIKNQTFELKRRRLESKQALKSYQKIDILRFDWKIQNLKVKPELKRYCKYKYIEN